MKVMTKFYWLIVSADFEIEDTKVWEILLQEIIKLFFTVRLCLFKCLDREIQASTKQVDILPSKTRHCV